MRYVKERSRRVTEIGAAPTRLCFSLHMLPPFSIIPYYLTELDTTNTRRLRERVHRNIASSTPSSLLLTKVKWREEACHSDCNYHISFLA